MGSLELTPRGGARPPQHLKVTWRQAANALSSSSQVIICGWCHMAIRPRLAGGGAQRGPAVMGIIFATVVVIMALRRAAVWGK